MASDTTHTSTSPNNGTHTTTTHTSGGGSGLAFILGGVVVALAVLAWLFMGGETSDDVTVTVEGAGEAVEAVEGAAEGVAGAAEGAAEAVEGAAAEATNN